LNPLFAPSLLLCALAAMPASASIVFDNYPINGTILGFQVNGGVQISDSFVLGSAATLSGVNFGAWNFAGDTITSVDWAIGNTPFTSIGTDHGTATVSGTFQFTNAPGFDIYSDTFALPGVALGPGTYYLTLSNAVTKSGVHAFWDENDGAGVDAWRNDGSLAQLSGTNCGFLHPNAGTCAQSFQILGSSTVPEPGTISLLGGGLLLLGGLVRRRR
jgi:PEP-CTERM motif